jgi:hypothetical protein
MGCLSASDALSWNKGVGGLRIIHPKRLFEFCPLPYMTLFFELHELAYALPTITSVVGEATTAQY